MEENERLRAILGEWSTRAAKVPTILWIMFTLREFFFFSSFSLSPLANPTPPPPKKKNTNLILHSHTLVLIYVAVKIVSVVLTEAQLVKKLERALEVERMSNIELQKKISTRRNQHGPAESNEHDTV